MTSPPVPPQAEPTAMCECSHHWRMHAESGHTSRSRVCHGTTGSATPGPYHPCHCRGFAPWDGPRDARTGEPVRPLVMAVDARQQPSVTPVPPQAIAAAVETLLAGGWPGGESTAEQFTRDVLEAAAPHLAAAGQPAVRVGGGRWVIEIEGGPAFAINAAQACNLAAHDLPPGPMREALTRVAEAFKHAALLREAQP